MCLTVFNGPFPGDTVAQKEKELLGKELLKQQLDLAIQWDRLDIAEEFIFSNMILKV